MNRLLATLIAGFFAIGAFAQTPVAVPVVSVSPGVTAAIASPAKADSKTPASAPRKAKKAPLKTDEKAETGKAADKADKKTTPAK